MKKQKINRENIEIKNIVTVLVYTVLFFLFMYLVTALITGELKLSKDKKLDTNPDVSIQYRQILAGEIFNKPEIEYYVIFYEFEDVGAQILNTVVDKYSQKAESLKVYFVNLSNIFNKGIFSDITKNLTANKVTDLKIQDNTLIKIKNGKNILQVEGKAAIIEHMNK